MTLKLKDESEMQNGELPAVSYWQDGTDCPQELSQLEVVNDNYIW